MHEDRLNQLAEHIDQLRSVALDPERTAYCYADEPITPTDRFPTVVTMTNSWDIGRETAFNMDYYVASVESVGQPTQTIACLAGHAAWLFHPDLCGTGLEDDDIHDIARKALDLKRELARHLFRPTHHDNENITSKQASDVLRHLASSGELPWRH